MSFIKFRDFSVKINKVPVSCRFEAEIEADKILNSVIKQLATKAAEIQMKLAENDFKSAFGKAFKGNFNSQKSKIVKGNISQINKNDIKQQIIEKLLE